jgi:hypothetical protein
LSPRPCRADEILVREACEAAKSKTVSGVVVGVNPIEKSLIGAATARQGKDTVQCALMEPDPRHRTAGDFP